MTEKERPTGLPIIKFCVTEDHMKLLKRLNIVNDENFGFGDFGSPKVDSKRPYGNSDVYDDIGNILGIEPEEKEDRYTLTWSDEQIEYMDNLHGEMSTVLQILVQNLSIEPGTYEAEKYIERWRRNDY